MRRLLRLGLLLAVFGVVTAAAGVNAASANDHQKQATGTDVDVFDCTGNLYNITFTYNAVSHEANGKSTETETGRFVATPVDAGLAASGHFTVWDGFHENADGSVAGEFTFNINGTYADGTRFSIHQQGQFRAASDGTITKDRFHDSCAA